jgi:hypothetical protein
MGKVVSRMLDRKSCEGMILRRRVPQGMNDYRKAVGVEPKMAGLKGEGRTSPLRTGRAVRHVGRRIGS